MKPFNDYFNVIIKHEGGLVDHPNDPGGTTKYGVSLLFLKDLNLEDGDIDHDGDIDKEDIKVLTVEDSKELYMKFFWDPLHLEGITSDLLKLHVFDHGVNAGTRTSVKLLQRMLGLTEDGSIGKITTKKINEYQGNIVDEYKQVRINYYLNIISKNPKLEVFKKGWINRVETTKF